MEKVHPGILFLAALGLVLVGNTIAAQGGFLDVIGTGIGLFGDILLIYSLYLGIKWAFGKKPSDKKAPPPTMPKQS